MRHTFTAGTARRLTKSGSASAPTNLSQISYKLAWPSSRACHDPVSSSWDQFTLFRNPWPTGYDAVGLGCGCPSASSYSYVTPNANHPAQPVAPSHQVL